MLLLVAKYLRFSNRADCCDGSDEYDGFAKCANTCWEAGKISREKLVKKVNVYREGLKIRRGEIESGKKLRQQNDITLTSLRKEEKLLNEQVQKLKGWSSRIFWVITAVYVSSQSVHLMLNTDVLLSITYTFMYFGLITLVSFPLDLFIRLFFLIV